MHQFIYTTGFKGNLAPEIFHKYAIQYYECRQSFRAPDGFSPVPYFLLCRAIELELKARLLHKITQEYAKQHYGHKLDKIYQDIEPVEQILDKNEKEILITASDIYSSKGFEYFTDKTVEAIANAYSNYPDLDLLNAIAKKLIEGRVSWRL